MGLREGLEAWIDQIILDLVQYITIKKSHLRANLANAVICKTFFTWLDNWVSYLLSKEKATTKPTQWLIHPSWQTGPTQAPTPPSGSGSCPCAWRHVPCAVPRP